MNKKPTYTQIFGALAPPEKDGKADWISRLAIGVFLRGTYCWRARPDNPQEAPLVDMVARLCSQMGIRTPPALILYHSEYPNAASVINGKIVVSDNILSILTPEQLQGIMAHELSHHRHKLRDTGIMMGGLWASDFSYRMTLRSKVTHFIKGIHSAAGRTALSIAEPVVSFLAAVGLINLYQQKCEYEADRESGEATGQPKIMAEALSALGKRINEVQAQERQKIRAGMSDSQKVLADTVETFEPKWLRRIRRNPLEVLGSHPPIASRVKALEAQEARHYSDPLADRPASSVPVAPR